MTDKPALLLLPNLLGEHRFSEVFLPSSVEKAVKSLDGLIAESEQAGRRYLSRFLKDRPATDVPIALFNEHTPKEHIDFLLEPILQGERWGLISDAGLPCIADPGALLVRRARQRGILIQAFVGPSSILMALMLSGLPGQRFYFHGYLDRDEKKREEQLSSLLKMAEKDKATQIFIETPYRNQQLLTLLLEKLPSKSWLCVAWDLTLPTQGVVSQTIHSWKKTAIPNLDKKPAIFLISAE